MKPDDASVIAEATRLVEGPLEDSEHQADSIKIVAAALTAAMATGAAGQREADAAECDRFLEKLKGRSDERADGAWVAITRLARNIRATAPDPTAYHSAILAELRAEVEKLPRHGWMGSPSGYYLAADVLALLKGQTMTPDLESTLAPVGLDGQRDDQWDYSDAPTAPADECARYDLSEQQGQGDEFDPWL